MFPSTNTHDTSTELGTEGTVGTTHRSTHMVLRDSWGKASMNHIIVEINTQSDNGGEERPP